MGKHRAPDDPCPGAPCTDEILAQKLAEEGSSIWTAPDDYPKETLMRGLHTL